VIDPRHAAGDIGAGARDLRLVGPWASIAFSYANGAHALLVHVLGRS
jgi:hypothetical protein